MNDHTTKLPITFWIIGGVALIWNLLGIFNFLGQTFMSAETLAKLPEDQQAMYEAVPIWVTVAFGLAVLSGTIASAGLLLKKGWAVPLFFISFVAILIQMTYNVLLSNAKEVLGPTFVALPLLILGIAVFFYYYAKGCRAKGWIG